MFEKRQLSLDKLTQTGEKGAHENQTLQGQGRNIHEAASQNGLSPASFQEAFARLAQPDVYRLQVDTLHDRFVATLSQRWVEWSERCDERLRDYQQYLSSLKQMEQQLSWLAPDSELLQEISSLAAKIQDDCNQLTRLAQAMNAETKAAPVPLTHTPDAAAAPFLLQDGPVDAASSALAEGEASTDVSAMAGVMPAIDVPPSRSDNIAETPSMPAVALKPSVTSDALADTPPVPAVDVASPPVTPDDIAESTSTPTLRSPKVIRTLPLMSSDPAIRRLLRQCSKSRSMSKFRRCANELQQARRNLTPEQWTLLLEALAYQLFQARFPLSSLASFTVVYQALAQRFGELPSEQHRQSVVSPEPAPPESQSSQTDPTVMLKEPAKTSQEPAFLQADSGVEPGNGFHHENDGLTEYSNLPWRERIKRYLPAEVQCYVQEVEENLYGNRLDQLRYVSPQQAALALESIGALARLVQDHLPEEEQMALRSWFGILNEVRSELAPDIWLDSLNRDFTPEQGWLAVHQEKAHEQEELQRAEREKLQRELSKLEARRRQRLMALDTLARLKTQVTKLKPEMELHEPEAQAFIQSIREALLHQHLTPSNQELLSLVTPFQSWFAEGREFRHLRRHLRKKKVKPDAHPVLPANTESLEIEELPFEESDLQEDNVGDEPKTHDAITQLLRKIIPDIQGHRALIIGGDLREEKRQRLEKRLKLGSLDWIPSEEGSIRKTLQAVKRIESGQVDLLILLLSFCGHSKVNSLIQAAKRHNVLWIPVDHGHGEVRVIRCIAYYLGYLDSSER